MTEYGAVGKNARGRNANIFMQLQLVVLYPINVQVQHFVGFFYKRPVAVNPSVTNYSLHD